MNTKPFAHLEQEVPDPHQQRAFQIPLLGIRRDRQKIELVRVLDDLLGQIRFRRRQGAGKIRHCLALPILESGFDLVGKHRAAPAVLERRLGVPKPGGRILELGQQLDVLAPGQSSNDPLDNCRIRPGLGEGAACRAGGPEKTPASPETRPAGPLPVG
jgi:hypothetical protein